MGRISVIIISWNARGYLRDCLNSLRQTGTPVVHEVIVVDNASSDGSPEMVVAEFPEVKLVPAGGNLGFARANNLGIKQATGAGQFRRGGASKLFAAVGGVCGKSPGSGAGRPQNSRSRRLVAVDVWTAANGVEHVVPVSAAGQNV
jgi:cellulose synthase/poly-beta-1,6-N-acetylglucosamine synthase-like glycosyltransferase